MILLTGATAHSLAHFGEGSDGIFLDDVGCDGSESLLLDCPYDANTIDCSHFEDAGVTCAESISMQLISYIQLLELPVMHQY